jgi:hypothetical protein
MEIDKVKWRQLIITVCIFCAGVIFCGDVGAASLAAMVWVLWLIYCK